jgi:hypothetical protein
MLAWLGGKRKLLDKSRAKASGNHHQAQAGPAPARKRAKKQPPALNLTAPAVSARSTAARPHQGVQSLDLMMCGAASPADETSHPAGPAAAGDDATAQAASNHNSRPAQLAATAPISSTTSTSPPPPAAAASQVTAAAPARDTRAVSIDLLLLSGEKA